MKRALIELTIYGAVGIASFAIVGYTIMTVGSQWLGRQTAP